MAEAAETQQRGEERFSLTRMLGAGPDGVSYGGHDTASQRPIVLHRLKLDGARREALTEQLALLELAKGEGVLEVVHADLAALEPVLAVERPASTLLVAKLEREKALKLIRAVALLLGRAHRVGLFHGALSPAAIFLRDSGAPALDFLNPATSSLLESPFDAHCRSPERLKDSASDIFALGALLSLTLTGDPPTAFDATATAASGEKKDEVTALIREMTDAEPVWRPSASEVAVRLTRLLDGRTLSGELPGPAAEDYVQLGRFKIDVLLGKGAMGRVYRATDLSDGKKVALKLIDGPTASSVAALRRFRKEARLLSEVKNPYIANLIDANRDAGVHFIAVELAEGKDLGAVLKEKGGLSRG